MAAALDDGGRLLDAWGGAAAARAGHQASFSTCRAGLSGAYAGERVEAIGSDRVRLSEGGLILRSKIECDGASALPNLPRTPSRFGLWTPRKPCRRGRRGRRSRALSDAFKSA